MATEPTADAANAFFIQFPWLIPLAPFVAFLLILWLRNRLPRRGAEIAVPAVGFSLLWSLGVFYEMWTYKVSAEVTFPWMTIAEHHFEFGFLVDNLSGFLALLVSFLSFLIVVYSAGYMREEGDKRPRYYASITLFISGMLATVLADNYLLMFIAWEIMGLCSYLLIGFWFERPSAASAAKKAFLVTRVGDVSLLLGLLILWNLFGTFSYRDIFANTEVLGANPGWILLASLFIFGGAVGKSAQFPLHVWLPDAMEGPTTVSALIHAATMVKAGVFLVARSFPLFIWAPDVFLLIALLGGITAFIAATMALVQWDIKRVLAYSTLSQLGYMFLALGAGGLLALQHGDSIGYTAGMFHLMNHAFFKALLFLGAGSVILGMHHQQDMRKMGGLHRKMPVTSTTILIGSLAIAGIPVFSGFWSKDEVLASIREAGNDHVLFMVLWVLALVTALLTAFYMFRMWFLTFAGKPRSEGAEHAHESPRVMTVPLQILAFFAIVAGFFLFAGFTDLIHFDANEFMTSAPEAQSHSALETFNAIAYSPYTYASVLVAAVGIWFAHRVYVRHRPHPETLVAPLAAHDAHKVLTNLYYYDKFFMKTGQVVGMGLARVSAAIDHYFVDGLVRGSARMSRWSGRVVGKTQTGAVTTYAFGVIVGLTTLVVAIAWILRNNGGL